MIENKKVWSNFDVAKKRFCIGMFVSMSFLVGTLVYIFLYGVQSLPVFIKIYGPLVPVIIMGISWFQLLFAGNEVEAQYN